jgi:lipid-binding SYLF domain-containing protein
MRTIAITACFVFSAAAMPADSARDRLTESTSVLTEIMGTPDKGIPQDLLDKAECVVVIPGLKKAAFVIVGQFGRGFVTCRNASGSGWGAPAAVRMEGGSVGFQIGGSSTDLVMLVMNKGGMNKLMSSKFTVGADASVAAGPVGRTAAAGTDAQMSAELLSWSRSQGVFAGLALDGATLRADEDENATLYGHKMTTREVLTGKMTVPDDAKPMVAELNRHSMHSESSGAERRK